MNKNRTSMIIAAALVFAGAVNAQEITKLKTFYFGNSYLENTMVGFHPILGKTAGKSWEVIALIHPGVPIWVHAVRQTEPESGNYKQFHREGAATDAIVMLQFAGMGLKYIVDDMWEGKFKFDPPRDVGDIASCITIIQEYLKMNPRGRAYVYTAWPSSLELKEFAQRVKEEALRSAEYANLPREEVMKRVKKEVHVTDDQMEPFLEAFDFEEAWLAKDYISEYTPPEQRKRFGQYMGCIMRNARDKAWKPALAALAEAAQTTEEQVVKDLAFIRTDIEQLRAAENPRAFLAKSSGEAYRTHSRPHDYALLEGIKKEFPEMWSEGRLGMIPVGDVMLELHRKIKAGVMPPLKGVGQLAPGHMRSGLGRYMLGATFYAVLFRDHPKNLNAAIYADRNNYIKDVGGLNKPAGPFYVHVPDLGRHIEITTERKKTMDDTIWEVVSRHPYTQVKSETTLEEQQRQRRDPARRQNSINHQHPSKVGWQKETWGIHKTDITDLDTLGNQELAALGMIDVTAAPFAADPTGQRDSTQAIQDAVFFGRHHKMAVYFPLGTYRVSDTIECRGGWSDERHADHRYLPYCELWPCVLIGERRDGRRPVIQLAERSAGFDDPEAVKPVLLFDSREWHRKAPLAPLDDRIGATGHNQLLYGFEVAIGAGNAGAACVYFDQAEGSTIQDCAFRIGDGHAGIWGAPGSGGALFNLEFSGGQVGIGHIGRRPTLTLAGGIFEGQRKCAVDYCGRGPAVLVGCEFRLQPGVPALCSSPARKTQYTTTSGANLVDCRIEYLPAGNAPAGPWAALDAGFPVTARNLWVKGAPCLVRDISRPDSAPQVELAPHGWSHVREAAFPCGRDAFAPITSSITVDGQERDRILDWAPAGGPPADDLCRRHIRWDWQSYPGWNDPAVGNVRAEPYNAAGDGLTDDTDAIQRALDASEVVFLPKGAYRISRPLRLRQQTKLFGLSPAYSMLVPSGEFGSAFADSKHPQPVIETPDRSDADVSIAFIGVFMPREITPAAALLDWRCGGRSHIRCFIPFGGCTELDTIPLFLEVYPWTNWEWSEPLLDISRHTGSGGIYQPGCVPQLDTDDQWLGSEKYRDRIPNWPLIHVRGNGGGGFYPFITLFGREHGPDFRKILVEGIAGPFEVYHALLQYCLGEAEMEIRRSANVHVYGSKNETYRRQFWIRDSERIRIYGTGAVGIPGKEKCKFTIERSSDVVLTTLFLDSMGRYSEHKGPMVDWLREDGSVFSLPVHDYPTWFEVSPQGKTTNRRRE